MMPMQVESVYDDPEHGDRYTVVISEEYQAEYKPKREMLTLSYNCNSPQGISQHVIAEPGAHLGERVEWSELPEHIRDHIVARVSDRVVENIA